MSCEYNVHEYNDEKNIRSAFRNVIIKMSIMLSVISQVVLVADSEPIGSNGWSLI